MSQVDVIRLRLWRPDPVTSGSEPSNRETRGAPAPRAAPRRIEAAGGVRAAGIQKCTMMSPEATTWVLRFGATPVLELPLNAAWLAAW